MAKIQTGRISAAPAVSEGVEPQYSYNSAPGRWKYKSPLGRNNREHNFLKCSCGKEHCRVCSKEIETVCTQCGLPKEELTTCCCGRNLNKKELEGFKNGTLDFTEDGWVNKNSESKKKKKEPEVSELKTHGGVSVGSIDTAGSGVNVGISAYAKQHSKNSKNLYVSTEMSLDESPPWYPAGTVREDKPIVKIKKKKPSSMGYSFDPEKGPPIPSNPARRKTLKKVIKKKHKKPKRPRKKA